jgi:hypothetical protein
MTTTSPGAHEFPVKYVVVAIVAAVFVAAVFAIAQWAGTESQQIVASPSEAPTAAVESYTGPSGLTQAFADGKLDAGLVPTPSQAVTGSDPVPETVLIKGEGSNYDALIAGKFAMDFNALDPGVHYVRATETAPSVGGLDAALAEGKLDAGLISTPSQAVTGGDPVPETVLIEGQGGNYDALIAGKFAVDFNALDPGVEYARAIEATPNVIGLRAALAEGKLDAGLIVIEVTAEPLPATARTSTLSGGQQQ